jgi:hypothetical protein
MNLQGLCRKNRLCPRSKAARASTTQSQQKRVGLEGKVLVAFDQSRFPQADARQGPQRVVDLSHRGAFAVRLGQQLPAIPAGGEDSFNRVIQASAMAKRTRWVIKLEATV